MTFAELKTKIRNDLWPDGEPENLVTAHNNKFVEALVDLQDAVLCYRFGNTDVYPHCSTYFNCGMTVLPAPRGKILRVYTIGKQDSTDGTISSGTTVGTLELVASDLQLMTLVQGVPTVPSAQTNTVFECTEDGLYTITVEQGSPSWSAYPLNSPQYVRNEITYTDTNGDSKTVQPADLLHVNSQSNSGTTVISVKSGTIVQCVTTIFNSPIVDGGLTLTVTAVKGSQVDEKNWCKKVFYDRVQYCHLERYNRLRAKTTSGIYAVADALVTNLFGLGDYRNKQYYPPPDDAGYDSLPSLPQGFHYPQKSTDAGGRSCRGVYAIHRGRIYIAPWIESTESVVIEWVGIKTSWQDTDVVEDNPKFVKAVAEYVGKEHYTWYESDDTRKTDFIRNYAFSVRELIAECRERNETTLCAEAGTSQSAASGLGAALDASAGGGLFYNTEQSFTANCGSGQSGTPVTSTIPAGAVSSALSVADANAQALAQAQADAQSKLVCTDSPSEYLNTVQTYTASCPTGATGNSVTVTTPAGYFKSTVSQAYADAAALADATEKANAQLSCLFYNVEQTATASCPSGSTGDDASATVAAGQFTSTISQADADAKALAEAQNQANAALSCSGDTFLVFNTVQTAQIQGNIPILGCSAPFIYNITGYCPPGKYSKLVTADTQFSGQAAVNLQAKNFANQDAQSQFAAAKIQWSLNCPKY